MTTKDADPAALVRVFHNDGFIALDRAHFGLSDAEVARVAAAVQARYDQFVKVATTHAIDLTNVAHAERIPGFYVRQGGRIDMELVSEVAKTNWNLPHAGAAFKSLVADVKPVETALFRGLEDHWKSVVDAVFSTNESSSLCDQYALDYIGCVIARPGDSDQNWHLDGVHRDPTQHEPADRINVFVPLVAVTPEIGGTEMKRRSQFRDDSRRGAAFDDYAALESVTHYVAAGTPVVMDYRVWHRGRANTSASVLRPLLYFKYTRKAVETLKTKREAEATSEDGKAKKKKRVALIRIS